MRVIKQDDFDIVANQVDCAQKWFDVQKFDGYIIKTTVSFKWKDQGYKNRKGKIWLKIIRGVEVILETRQEFFGTAPHNWGNVIIHLTRADAVVREFRPGDYFRFMRYIGGGGAHSLHVRDFKTLVELRGNL